MSESIFNLKNPFLPAGDQPRAIEQLVNGLNKGKQDQVLLGVTGSGKTFTMANIIQQMNRPTLVLSHNKTLAAQLCSEFREYFPDNAVCYFVSYYDYYQPEAYIAKTDTYIEKDASINEEIDKFRHQATMNLLTRRDVIIVSSVSCIYGLGDVDDYENLAVKIKVGEIMKRDKLLRMFSDIQYERNDMNFARGKFRVRGDIVEIHPSYSDHTYRIDFFGDEIESIKELDFFTKEVINVYGELAVFPAKHTVSSAEKIKRVVVEVEKELKERFDVLRSEGKEIEAQRLKKKTEYDMEMLLETGYCTGIENYTRYLGGRGPGETPATLLEYFPKDYLMFIDESHITVPQIGGMFNGNYSRKESLVNHGFRMPSSFDNRPLRFEEFKNTINQVVYVSATPGKYEMEKVKGEVVEQIIRPTGLIDPEIVVRSTENQIDDLIHEINLRVDKKERVLVTTLTKRMAEDLTDFFQEKGIKVRYLHSDIDTMQRIEILRDLRLGEFDVLVGINLLREGLDLPEVSLVAILDADKEGFLRSEGALIQTVGRAARNISGKVIMYAEIITKSMDRCISETNRRREIQEEYNRVNNIIPQSIIKGIKDISVGKKEEIEVMNIPKDEVKRMIQDLEKEMDIAASEMNFERAAELRDQIENLEANLK